MLMLVISIIVALMFVVSKLCDVITTIKYVGVKGESNQLARLLFERWGFLTTLWMVFALCVLVGIGCVIAVWLINWLPLSIVLTIMMFVLTLFQFSVARFNACRKHNLFTRIVAHFYFNPEYWRRVLRIFGKR